MASEMWLARHGQTGHVFNGNFCHVPFLLRVWQAFVSLRLCVVAINEVLACDFNCGLEPTL